MTKKILVIAASLKPLGKWNCMGASKSNTYSHVGRMPRAESTDNWMWDTLTLFQEQNPHVEFEMIDNTWGDQYLTQITTLMATGRTPDIFATWTSGRMEPICGGRPSWTILLSPF